MSLIALSVIICTHNPREAYLCRVLDSLKAQTLSKEQWELLLIDNASASPLSESWDLSWHPGGRHVREEELGLTAARLCGIAETRAPLLVFVDDDNVLAPDYLSSALEIAAKFPFVGIFSGRVEPEFEVAAPSHLHRFWSYLALHPVPTSFWSNYRDDWTLLPAGAGMCVRAEIAQDYAKKIANDPLRKSMGRKGTALSSCEDTDLGLHACDLGWGYGRFSELRLLHLIPASRLELGYLLNLEEKISESTELLRFCRHGTKPDYPVGLRKYAGIIRRLIMMRAMDRKVFDARIRAKRQAALRIEEISGGHSAASSQRGTCDPG